MNLHVFVVILLIFCLHFQVSACRKAKSGGNMDESEENPRLQKLKSNYASLLSKLMGSFMTFSRFLDNMRGRMNNLNLFLDDQGGRNAETKQGALLSYKDLIRGKQCQEKFSEELVEKLGKQSLVIEIKNYLNVNLTNGSMRLNWGKQTKNNQFWRTINSKKTACYLFTTNGLYESPDGTFNYRIGNSQLALQVFFYTNTDNERWLALAFLSIHQKTDAIYRARENDWHEFTPNNKNAFNASDSPLPNDLPMELIIREDSLKAVATYRKYPSGKLALSIEVFHIPEVVK